MSEQINKYNTGKIYKIWSPSREDLVYYGSTIEKLNRRLAGHKDKYRLYKAGGKCENRSSFKIFDECSDYRIDLVESYPCNSREELNSREGYYIKNNTCVNKFIAGRTLAEYRIDNKEMLKDKNKKYRLNNKEKEKARHKKYNDDHKEQSKQYYQANKDKKLKQSKQYMEANRDKILERRRQYWAANKDKINARRRELKLLKE